MGEDQGQQDILHVQRYQGLQRKVRTPLGHLGSSTSNSASVRMHIWPCRAILPTRVSTTLWPSICTWDTWEY